MCIPAAFAALGPLFGGTTAAGAAAGAATAGAATVGSSLATLGTVVSIGGALAQGIAGMQASKASAAAIRQQQQTEVQLNATEDQRRRAQMNSQISQQRAELAARGITLDSVTAVMLGQTAAKELSFESQATRAGGQARQQELSAQERAVRAEGTQSLLKGGFSAAGTLLKAAPDIWPGFMDKRVGRQLA